MTAHTLNRLRVARQVVAATLAAALVFGTAAWFGFRILLADEYEEERAALQVEADALAEDLSHDLTRFHVGATTVGMLTPDALVELIGRGDRTGVTALALIEDAESVRALGVYVDDVQITTQGDASVLEHDVAAGARAAAAATGVASHTDLTLYSADAPLAAWATPLEPVAGTAETEDDPVRAVAVFVVDISRAIDDELALRSARVGQGATVAQDPELADEDVIWATSPVDGTPWHAVVWRSRADVVGGERALYTYAVVAVLALSFAVGIGAEYGRRIRRERDVERHARELLVDQMSAEERFLAAMSHELRTPLNSIIGFSGVLAGGHAGDINPEQHQQLRMIERSGRRMLALVDDVLDLSRVRAGATLPERRRFDAGQCAREALRTVEPIASEKRLTLVADLPSSPLLMHTDQAMVERILFNLLGNAVKFTESGSVTLHIRLQGKAHVRFEVKDTGPGIPEEELGRVTQEFYQVARSEGSAKPAGTGLGLAISMQLARLLGGAIEIDSAVGTGSVFSLVIPRDLPDANEV